MTKIHYITAEGLEKLKEELNVLTTVERVAAARAIAEARDKGDLTENSEYDAAKDAQAMLEMKIAKLQYMIANARICLLYTSRAHETPEHLVCRLLLEKKKHNHF